VSQCQRPPSPRLYVVALLYCPSAAIYILPPRFSASYGVLVALRQQRLEAQLADARRENNALKADLEYTRAAQRAQAERFKMYFEAVLQRRDDRIAQVDVLNSDVKGWKREGRDDERQGGAGGDEQVAEGRE
jgi:hypothetical protein